jgi:hypothetical protein
MAILRKAVRIAFDTIAILTLAYVFLIAIAYAYDFVVTDDGTGSRPAGRRRNAVEAPPSLPPVRNSVRHHEELSKADPTVVERVLEAGRLTAAMCDWLTSHGCGTDECERRELEGLATAIVETVAEEDSAGRWVPIDRAHAPALLAAWSFHEVSWHWRRPPIGRSNHEVGAFQFHGVALQFVEPGFERDAVKAARGAIHYMHYLSGFCHSESPQSWGGAYISGDCGGVPDEVSRRTSQSRRLYDRMSSNP